MFDLSTELKKAKEAAISAGKEILTVYNTDFTVEYKDDKSPLTLADKKANEIIYKKLVPVFPNYAWLSEESKDNPDRLNNDWCWVVDPLDGTKEFLKKNDEFTVNIALVYQGKSVLGVIYAPCRDELYYAVNGSGAFLEKSGETKKISVSDNTENLILVASRSHISDKLKEIIKKYNITNTISIGSSLKGCLIASGQADIYYRFGYTMEWDTAAMQCIVEEAGAVFKQMDGSEMLYNRKNSLNELGFYILNKLENKFNI